MSLHIPLGVQEERAQDVADWLRHRVSEFGVGYSGSVDGVIQTTEFALAIPGQASTVKVVFSFPFPHVRGEVVVEVSCEGEVAGVAQAEKLAADLLEKVRGDLLTPLTRAYRRYWLISSNGAIAGEYWLDDQIRLGPPSKKVRIPKVYLLERPIAVDLEFETIPEWQATDRTGVRILKEISALFAVVVRSDIHPLSRGAQWVWVFEHRGKNEVVSRLRQLGFHDPVGQKGMPRPGELCQAGPFEDIARPDFSERHAVLQLPVPADLHLLYRSYRALPVEEKYYFLNACVLYQKSLEIHRVFPSAAFGAMVSAAETLGGLTIGRSQSAMARFRSTTMGTFQLQDDEWKRFVDGLYGDRSEHQHAGAMLGDELKGFDMPFNADYSGFDRKYAPLEKLVAAGLVDYLLKRAPRSVA